MEVTFSLDHFEQLVYTQQHAQASVQLIASLALLHQTRGELDASFQASGMTGLPAKPAHAGLVAIVDNTNFGLGMIAIDEAGTRYLNQVLIPRSTPIPAEGIQAFSHVFQPGRADALEVFVTQGDVDDPASVSYLGLYSLSSLPGAPSGTRCKIEIGFAYDRSGMVKVSARAAAGRPWVPLERSEVPDDVPRRFERLEVTASPEPLTVMLFFDVSGSMGGLPIQAARKAAVAFVDGMDLTVTKVGIGVVADCSKLIIKPASSRAEILQAIERIDVCAMGAGGGNSGHPFDDIRDVMRPERGSRAAVVLADGVWDDQQTAIKAARLCRKDGIDIVAIGFGYADEGFLNAISSARELGIFTDQNRLTETFSSIARVINRRAGLLSS